MNREVKKILIKALLDYAPTTIDKKDQLIYTLNERQTYDFIEDLVKKLTVKPSSTHVKEKCKISFQDWYKREGYAHGFGGYFKNGTRLIYRTLHDMYKKEIEV